MSIYIAPGLHCSWLHNGAYPTTELHFWFTNHQFQLIISITVFPEIVITIGSLSSPIEEKICGGRTGSPGEPDETSQTTSQQNTCV